VRLYTEKAVSHLHNLIVFRLIESTMGKVISFKFVLKIRSIKTFQRDVKKQHIILKNLILLFVFYSCLLLVFSAKTGSKNDNTVTLKLVSLQRLFICFNYNNCNRVMAY